MSEDKFTNEMQTETAATSEVTPEEELALAVAKYGPFALAKMDVNMLERTVTVELDEPLEGKKKLIYTTEIPEAAMMIFNDLGAELLEKAKAVKPFGGR